jgi:hypothetical protein
VTCSRATPPRDGRGASVTTLVEMAVWAEYLFIPHQDSTKKSTAQIVPHQKSKRNDRDFEGTSSHGHEEHLTVDKIDEEASPQSQAPKIPQPRRLHSMSLRTPPSRIKRRSSPSYSLLSQLSSLQFRQAYTYQPLTHSPKTSMSHPAQSILPLQYT